MIATRGHTNDDLLSIRRAPGRMEGVEVPGYLVAAGRPDRDAEARAGA